MSDRTSTEHLSPENFVDLIDAAPVDATYRLHLKSCLSCRQELDELERTLAAVKSTRGGEEETAVPVVQPVDKTVWRYALWASAAAVLVSVLASWPENPRSVVAPGAEEHETLLAPIEDDEDYRLLLALSQDAEDAELLFDAVHNAVPFSPDPEELTPSEQWSLIEGLAQALRSRS